MLLRMTGGLALMILAAVFSCAGEARPELQDHPIVGLWEYRDCTFKNTSVRGTIEFRRDGTLFLDADARDDYPVGKIRGVYRYSIAAGLIESDYEGGYGLEKHFLVQGEYLYLFQGPVSGLELREDERRGGMTGNFAYRLARKK